MSTQRMRPPPYHSYLLRVWQTGDAKPVWRASLESPHTGERVGFADLDQLFACLKAQTIGLASHPAETSIAPAHSVKNPLEPFG